MSDNTYPTVQMQKPPGSTYDQSSSLIVDYSDAPETYHSAPQQAQQAQQVPHALQQTQQSWTPPPEKSSRICGMPRQTFWLVIILVIVVMTAAVGGGVGGSLAVENARSRAVPDAQPTTTTPTASTVSASGSTSSASPTVYVPTLPLAVTQLNSSCPASGLLTATVPEFTDRYNCSERTNFPSNDIALFSAYTLQQCAEACTNFNKIQGSKTCQGVAYSSRMSFQYQDVTGNCYLKKAFKSQGTQPNDYNWITAMLQD